jgi:lipid A 3-O-deacylase
MIALNMCLLFERGALVRVSVRAKQILGVAALAAMALVARPAAAQFSLGSPDGPQRLELGVGAFDITPDTHHKDAGTAGDFRGEYHFGDMLWIISPFVGADVTTEGATYAYFGFGFDINFSPNWVLTPNAAAGVFQRGNGTKLGSWWEYRTGAEFDYKFDDQSRLGLAIHHVSNDGLTRVNPGEQSALIVYQIPLHW